MTGEAKRVSYRACVVEELNRLPDDYRARFWRGDFFAQALGSWWLAAGGRLTYCGDGESPDRKHPRYNWLG